MFDPYLRATKINNEWRRKRKEAANDAKSELYILLASLIPKGFTSAEVHIDRNDYEYDYSLFLDKVELIKDDGTRYVNERIRILNTKEEEDLTQPFTMALNGAEEFILDYFEEPDIWTIKRSDYFIKVSEIDFF